MLRPCPFCGEEAWLEEAWVGDSHYKAVWIECSVCSSSSDKKEYYHADNLKVRNADRDSAVRSAMEMWNRRRPESMVHDLGV